MSLHVPVVMLWQCSWSKVVISKFYFADHSHVREYRGKNTSGTGLVINYFPIPSMAYEFSSAVSKSNNVMDKLPSFFSSQARNAKPAKLYLKGGAKEKPQDIL